MLQTWCKFISAIWQFVIIFISFWHSMVSMLMEIWIFMSISVMSQWCHQWWFVHKSLLNFWSLHKSVLWTLSVFLITKCLFPRQGQVWGYEWAWFCTSYIFTFVLICLHVKRWIYFPSWLCCCCWLGFLENALWEMLPSSSYISNYYLSNAKLLKLMYNYGSAT